MEIELKLLVSRNDAESLRHHPLLAQYAVAPPREQQLADTYFDTAQHHFRRAGAGLRVRSAAGKRVQTLKAGGAAYAGLHRRFEWESPVAGPEPELAMLRAMADRSPWGKLLRLSGMDERLRPVFCTQITRTVWDLRLPQGSLIECALDQGKLECGDEAVPVSELELELKAGDAVHLFDFALALQQAFPMQIATLNKAEQGYGLCMPAAAAAVKAVDVKLGKRASVEQAFETIAANCLGQMQANAAGVAHGGDREALHQMRVGLRRLRAVLGLFSDALQLPDDLDGELEWLADELGAARDWDVLGTATLPALAEAMPGEPRLALVQQAVSDAGRAARADASAAVGSVRYTRLVLGFGRWLHGAPWRGDRPQGRHGLEAPVARFADRVLRRAHKKLRKRGRGQGGASARVRHRVRIAAKNARYAAEFFASLYREKQVRPYVRALTELQDEFGKLNDAVVADGLLAQLQSGNKELDAALALARAVLAPRLGADDRRARKRWRRFKAVKPPA